MTRSGDQKGLLVRFVGFAALLTAVGVIGTAAIYVNDFLIKFGEFQENQNEPAATSMEQLVAPQAPVNSADGFDERQSEGTVIPPTNVPQEPATPASRSIVSVDLVIYQDETFETPNGTIVGVGDASSVTTPFLLNNGTFRLRPGQSIDVVDGCTITYRGLVDAPSSARQSIRVRVSCSDPDDAAQPE